MSGPPRRLDFALRHYGLGARPVLDIGCGPGEYLRHFGPGSVGLDLNPTRARNAGLDARAWNFDGPIPQDLRGRFDVVWCSNLLEHVMSPHEFLIEVRRALAGGGRLFVAVPATTPLRHGAWLGHLAADHVNFYTPRTLRRCVERAGYQIEFTGSPSLPALPVWVGKMTAGLAPVLLCVARVLDDFQYPAKAAKVLVDGEIVWKDSDSVGD